MVTESQEIVCINNDGSISLPSYEFDAVYGSEAVTTALERQMEEKIGYRGMGGKISLADAKQHYEYELEELLLAAPNVDDDDDITEAEFEKMLNGVDPKRTTAELAMANNSPFRVCVACDCIPCERKQEDRTTAPMVLWAREIFTYQPPSEWNAEREARTAQEKQTMRMPIEQWDTMIASGEITDRISVMATKIAQKWIATIKPMPSARKTPKKKKASKK
ncbi:MAG: hypothetical protein EXS60_00840 [Candidatus Pacebacteria bacterium]|nr:hypothetical protein [Candidatus Paceibacterota bacterium]